MPKRILALFMLLALLTTLGCAVPPAHRVTATVGSIEPTLILISLDGFRWDYLDWDEASGLRLLAAEGVRAKGLIPVFPSKTFPCHYSIVTGLYPGHHGIVSNNMIDSVISHEFHLGDSEAMQDPRWWGGEPIWVTAEQQGLIAAAMFWPGTEARINGVRPHYWHPYNKKFSFKNRVQQVLDWLDLAAEQRPRLITLYFEQPNDISHHFGPEAAETRKAVSEVDARVGDLIQGLKDRGLLGQIDIIVTSDHGMAEVNKDRVIVIDDYIRLEEGELFERGPYVQIFPRPGRETLIYNALKQAHPALAVYRRDEIPERFHLRNSPRTAPVIAIPRVGWEVLTRNDIEQNGDRMLKGDHGQDPADPLMHGLFIGYGPSFKRGLLIDRFENIEIYNLMTTILGLDGAPNDGDPKALNDILLTR